MRRLKEEGTPDTLLMGALLRAIPVAAGILIDRVFQWTNERMTDLTGYTLDELVGRSARMLYETEDEFARVGREKYGEMARCGVGTIKTSWVHKNGSMVPVLLSSAYLDPHNPALGTVFTATDLTVPEQAERALQVRERYLSCLVEIAAVMLSDSPLATGLPEVLHRLRAATDTDRCFLFEIGENEAGRRVARERYEVCAPHIPSLHYQPEVQEIPLVGGPLDRWVKLLEVGESLQGPVRRLPPNERAWLERWGIESVALCPLQVGGRWVGVLGFDETEFPREWQEEELTLLRTAARLISAAWERDQSTAALAASEAQHRILLEAIGLPVVALDAQLTVQYCNHPFATLVEVPVHKLMGSPLVQHVPEFQDHPIMEIWRQTLETGQPQDTQQEFREYILRVRSYPLPTGGLLSVLIDTTARRRAEERFQRAAEVASDLIYEWEVGSEELQWFGGITQTLGYEVGEIPSTVSGWLALIHPEDLPRLQHMWRGHRGTRLQPLVQEYRVRHKSGKWHYLVDRSVPILNREGQPIRWIGSCSDTTIQRESEHALQNLAQQWRATFDALGEGLMVLTPDCRIVRCNQKLQQWFARPVSQIINQPCYKLMHGLSAPPDFCIAQQVLAKKTRVTLELPLHNRWFQVSGDPIFNAEGEVVNLVHTFIDITEQRELEEALREGHERYQTLINNLQIGVFRMEIEPPGRFVDANPRLAQLLGYASPDELARVSAESFYVNPADRQALMEDLVRENRLVQRELRFRRRDGTSFWGQVTLTGLRGSSGQLEYLLGTLEDISERKAAEEALKAAHAQLSAIFETSPAAIIGLSRDERVNIWNPAAERIFGWTADEILGQPYPLAPPDKVAEHRALHRQVLAGEHLTAVEVQRQRKDGSLVELACSSAPIRTAAGQVEGCLVVMVDLTEQKRLQRLTIRSSKLESIGQLAAGIAHEFNNILTGIGGYASLCMEALDLDNPARQDLHHIQQLMKRAADLTRQLLIFSRQQPLERTTLPMSELVSHTIKLLKPLLGEAIVLKQQIAPDLGMVEGDRTSLEQVIVNLAINARDAMPNGGELTIEARNLTVPSEEEPMAPKLPPGEYIYLAVSDTGVGMEASVQEQIFEPFFTTKRLGEGSGLGLAVVHGVVTQHDGYIEVESAVGQGTTFHLYLPRTLQAAASLAEAAEAPVPGGRGETILLVEDEPAVRDVVASVLRGRGYQVIVCERPEKALTLSADQLAEVALMVTDVIMPGLSGVELYQRLRTRHVGLRVLYISGYTPEVLRDKLNATENSLLLHKPFTPHILLRKVQEVLAQGPVKVDLAGAEPS